MTKKRRPTSAVRLADSDTMDLAGEWYIALDRENAGIRGKWYARTLSETIALPGSTDEARMGDFVDEQCTDRLSRVWRWIGPAWYQKTVTIPKRWHGKRITLFLERTKDSQVWVDRTWVGSDDSLSTPHEFDLSRKLTPGRHTITILIDNAKLPPVGPCHQVDERTQTNWNGILGRIELRATDKVWLDEIQAHP
ncbi:MAG: beta-galactosidase, partial [Verrucomicrobia bacterium]|nr:beta-galactosidase [Verrucomicrobiota bacterium]